MLEPARRSWFSSRGSRAVAALRAQARFHGLGYVRFQRPERTRDQNYIRAELGGHGAVHRGHTGAALLLPFPSGRDLGRLLAPRAGPVAGMLLRRACSWSAARDGRGHHQPSYVLGRGRDRRLMLSVIGVQRQCWKRRRRAGLRRQAQNVASSSEFIRRLRVPGQGRASTSTVKPHRPRGRRRRRPHGQLVGRW